MSEFQNRIDAQRSILRIVNSSGLYCEQLFGLSDKSIARWVASNRLPENSPVAGLLFRLAARLFFLATKSQEQVTEDYKTLSIDVTEMCSSLQEQVRREKNPNGVGSFIATA